MAVKQKPRRRPTNKRASASVGPKAKPEGHITNAQRQRDQQAREELRKAVDSAEHRLYLLKSGQISHDTACLLTKLALRKQGSRRSA